MDSLRRTNLRKRWVVERTNSWSNAHKKLVWCTEKREQVVDFWIAFSNVIIIVRRLIRKAWSRYRWESRSEAMLGMVFEMDEWLESTDGEADELRVRREEQHRNELVEQLRFNRTRISLIRDELLKNKDGTP